MRYAKVVLDLPVEGPFDYIVPDNLLSKARTGSRVKVGFRTMTMTGYVVGLAGKSEVKNLKPLLTVIDESPVLNAHMLALTRKLSQYYCCSWGQAIATSLPEGLRKGKPLPEPDAGPEAPAPERNPGPDPDSNRDSVLIHDHDGLGRWETYVKEIERSLRNNRSSLLILPDTRSFATAKEILGSRINAPYAVLTRKQPGELKEWSRIRSGKVRIVIGTRSAVFAPLDNLGLLIIDEEQDTVYKQEQVPHYHCREIAFMRAETEKAKLILGSTTPSLESIYLARKGKLKYTPVPRKREFPEIKVIDMETFLSFSSRKNIILSRFLEDSISRAIAEKAKTLLFLNRTGFATLAHCLSCGNDSLSQFHSQRRPWFR